LVKDTQVLCKDGKIVIPKVLQHRAVNWYYHYLQHPGQTCLEEMLHAAMYWTGIINTIRLHVKNCHTFHINKQYKHKYGKIPTKLVIRNPLGNFMCDSNQTYTLKGKDGTEIDFMCLTMIDPASSRFERVELPVTTDLVIPLDTKGQKVPRHILPNK
jgi:hypothetical protein